MSAGSALPSIRVHAGALVLALSFAASPAAFGLPRGLPAPDDPLYQMRDPFRRPKVSDKEVVPKSEIELIPLEEFRLVGVSTGPRRSRALVQAANGKSWFVGVNDLMGANGGVVRRILSDRIVVARKVFDEIGQEQQVSMEIKLPEVRRPGGP